jgi:transcription elongation factor GreB
MEKKNYISHEGLKELTDERDRLMRQDRPEVVKLVKWAASLGDRSENADYQYGKRRLREIDRRIRYLNSRINQAIVVEGGTDSVLTVQFGAWVELSYDDGAQRKIKIMGEDEVDFDKSIISWKSPIAQAMLGKKLGDIIEIKAPRGLISAKIINIEYKDKL